MRGQDRTGPADVASGSAASSSSLRTGQGRGGGEAGNGPVSDSQPTGEELNGDEAVLCTRVGPRVNSLAISDLSPH